METIPPVYWMVLISILAIFFCLVLYHIAMLFKETTHTVAEIKEIVRESKGMIKNIEQILEESKEIVGTAKRVTLMAETTVEEVKNYVLEPVKKIGGALSIVSGFLDGLKK